MLAAALLVKRYLPDLRTAPAVAAGIAAKAAPASPAAYATPALEAPGSPH
jgi:hypothetical protein